ncbi:MAG: DUF4157 domain-containing protein [Nostoc sp.]|uniref:eCIS core domain-containing protein n=1 Tax=Nostoc sp. TaxID=1180 RepID=UPI002FF6A52E
MFYRQQGQILPKSNKAVQKQPTTIGITNDVHSIVQRAKADPSSLSADEVLTLQETIGNRAANRLLAARSTTQVQAKLTIGEVGDKYEQEADSVAREVVQQINAPAVSGQSEAVQRQMPEDKDDLQMQPIVQRVTNGGMAASADVEAGIQRARGGGQSLADNIREPMEQAFGADFRDVRVHTDSQADQLNQSIQAKAFTTGQDVFFRQGAYEPSSRGGQELLAHELTHVVQQGGGTVQRAKQELINILVPDQGNQASNSATERPIIQRVVSQSPVFLPTQAEIGFINALDQQVGVAEARASQVVQQVVQQANVQPTATQQAYITNPTPALWGMCVEEQLNPIAQQLGWQTQMRIGASRPDYHRLVGNTHVWVDLTTPLQSGNAGYHITTKLYAGGIQANALNDVAADITHQGLNPLGQQQGVILKGNATDTQMRRFLFYKEYIISGEDVDWNEGMDKLHEKYPNITLHTFTQIWNSQERSKFAQDARNLANIQ